jgi:Glycosyltransferase Family 4/Glycosyl transferases group 1
VSRFLFLTYHFPPIGGAGVQRSVQLCRHLPALGHAPTVVTGPGAPDFRWAPQDDLLEADSSVRVHRIEAPEPPRYGRWSGRAERWLRVTLPWQRWWERHALELALRVGRDCDLVYASVAPYQAAGSAIAIARALGRPLVVDFEDPWALDEMLVYPTALHRRLELRRMRRTLRAADAIVMNTDEAAHVVARTFPELRGRVVAAVPNRYDADDFADPVPARDDGRFRIVHTGSLHTDLGRRQRSAPRLLRALGGTMPGVDFLTRSHVFLLEALERLAQERPEVVEPVELHLAGVLTGEDLEIANASPFVRVRGFLPHRQTTELVRSADLLFLPMHDLPAGERARLVPCKTYEYLASGRPILAAVPDGDARDLLAEQPGVHLCRPTEVDEMRRVVAGVLAGGRPESVHRLPRLGRFERGALAAELTAVYRSVLPEPGSGRPGVDGSGIRELGLAGSATLGAD